MNIIVIKIHLELPDLDKEDLWKKTIYTWADERFESGYTVYETEGAWNGAKGRGFTIERYDQNLKLTEDRGFIKSLKELGKKLKQEEILLTTYTAESESVKMNYED
jgi:hypothetical protein